MFLLSPLEQFNIFSFFDLTLVGGIDSLVARLLLSFPLFENFFWFFFKYPFEALLIYFTQITFENLIYFQLSFLPFISFVYFSSPQILFPSISFLTFFFGKRFLTYGVSLTHLVFVLWYCSNFIGTTLLNLYFSILSFCFDNFWNHLIWSFDFSTIWQAFIFLVITFFFYNVFISSTLVPLNSWQALFHFFYTFIFNFVFENAGTKGRQFFPLIFTIFFLILASNLFGMIPYSFTVTSHLIITFSTALAIFLGLNILGMLEHGVHFFSLFFPPGAPLILAPLLVLIEFISYVFRVLSLSIRLFANLMSGHTLLKILASFSWAMVSLWGFFLIPLLIIFIVTGLELAIAFLQAYIFSVLLCIYLNDAFNLH